jgi:hypothetical protein
MKHDPVNAGFERQIQASFGLPMTIKSVVAARLPVGPSAEATLLLSDKNHLFVLIDGRAKLTFGEVKKVVRRMNLAAAKFLPPRGDPDYFQRIAAAKFSEVFPGRRAVHESDLTFYKTLVPYNPALVQISEVVDGVVKQFDTDAVGHWRPALKFSYRRIETS